MKDVIEKFKALSDETRLRILWVLKRAGERLCVCEIMDSLAIDQYNVSRHLKVLKKANLVEEKKDGRWVFYRLKNSSQCLQMHLLSMLEAIPEKFFSRDRERLGRRLALRRKGQCVVGMNNKKIKTVKT